jgi:hypothetical protein
METTVNRTSMAEKLEDFLDRACEAEASGGKSEAERLFRMALYCEGRLRPDVTEAREYVRQVGPVYMEHEGVGRAAGHERI